MVIGKKQIRSIELMYLGKNEKEISEELGITRQTYNRWLSDNDYKRACIEIASRKIGDIVPTAVKGLRDIVDDPDVKPRDKIQAIKTVFEYAQILNRKETEQDVKITVEYI